MEGQGTTLAAQFAEWVEQATYDQLPVRVVDEAKASLRDFVGNAVSGAVQSWMEPYRRLAAVNFGSGSSTVAMTAEPAAMRDAAFLNAVYCHAYEYDDILAGHPGSVVVATALALGERDHVSGRDLLTAIVIGYEIMCRSTAAIHPSEVKKGFNGTGLAGPYGSTAVAGKMLGLSADKLTNALGIAGNYSCGLMEYDLGGGECKRLYAAMSARAGLEAAQLADFGMTGPASVFEGKKGVFNTFGGTCDIALSRGGLGVDFKIVRRWCKAYPAVGTVHGAIDCVEALFAEHDIDPAGISKITVAVPHMTLMHGGSIKVPWDVVSAQFSLAYSVAIRAIHRSNKIDLYADPANWSDPKIVALIDRVGVVEDPDVVDGADAQVSMVLDLADGTSLRHVQPAPKGTRKNPLTRDESIDKYRESTEGLLAPDVVKRIEDAIDDLESIDDVAPFVALLKGDHAARSAEQ